MTDDLSPNDPLNQDYHKVLIPDDKPKSEWDVAERRAYLLSQIEKQGTPKQLNKTDIADDFDLSRQMIHEDMKILGEWMSKNMDREFEEKADAVMRWAIEKAIEEGDYRQARRGASEWQSFLQDAGEKDKQPDKLVISDDDSEVGYEVVEEESDSDE